MSVKSRNLLAATLGVERVMFVWVTARIAYEGA
jgi:hypothetical protein